MVCSIAGSIKRCFDSTTVPTWVRVKAGLEPRGIGERCGFYQTYLSRREREQANPTLNAIEVIANALGLTIYAPWSHVENLGRG